MHLIQTEPFVRIEPFSTDVSVAKQQLKDVVKQLNGAEVKPGLEARLFIANLVIEEYIHATEKRPDDYQLYALGSYLIDDYLTDQYKHHRKDEYPFKTDSRVKKNHARNRTIFLGDRTDVKA